MADDADGQDAGAEASGAGVDPAAMALALGSASRNRADRFLEEQTALAMDQRHHLREQFKQLRLNIWQQRMGVLLRVATGFMGLAVAGALAFMVWDAAHSQGLLVEPFSVPPDLAQRGLTGEVVATRVLDRLTLMQSQTNTARPALSYANAWSTRDFKLEIPETGVSLAELDNWLREKLGQDVRVSGEIVRSGSGISVTARAGGQGADSVSGQDADIDALVQKTAESVYRITQPYRYAIFLMRHENKPAEAAPIFKDLAFNGSPDDKAWSYNMWAQATGLAEGNAELEARMYQDAHAANPQAIQVYINLVNSQVSLGRYEQSLQFFKEWTAATAKEGRKLSAFNQTSGDIVIGAYHDASPILAPAVRTGVPGFPLQSLLRYVMISQAGEHDLAGAHASLAQYPPGLNAQRWDLMLAYASEDWKKALLLEGAMADYLKANPHDWRFALVNYAPYLAVAQARLGNFAGAERSIAPTPGDCYPCLIARAGIAEAQHQRERADWWFARAEEAAPSFAFAPAEWGVALLARGQTDEAIEKFKTANQKSPHFADPLEMWGEALMAKKQPDQALAKFAEAEKYAPNWGRLHLKWGEALTSAGKKDEAQKQFTLAATLDLSAADKAELARVSHG
jgi:tetratricopeptide (TPR) repeat protein